MNTSSQPDSSADWGAENSRTFIDYGRYFVPERQAQIEMICGLIPPLSETQQALSEQPGSPPFAVLELCCGDGSLAAALLERYPTCTVYGLDGSPLMLELARQRLADYGERFVAGEFDLAACDWREVDPPFESELPLHAVVSSLAIHHLDGEQKAALFADMYRLLAPGGVLVVADLVQPASQSGRALAADAWDAAVRQQAMASEVLDGQNAELVFAEFDRLHWNIYRYPLDPDDIDRPSPLFDQMLWLEAAGFQAVDVYWMRAGHAVFGGQK